MVKIAFKCNDIYACLLGKTLNKQVCKYLKHIQNCLKSELRVFPETLKYWVGVQRGQFYLMGRIFHFILGWPHF